MSETPVTARPSINLVPCRCSGSLPEPMTYTMDAKSGERWYLLTCGHADCTGRVTARNAQVCRDEWNGMQMGDATDLAACTYDNPATMQRECWQDGQLICSYKADLLMRRDPIPAEHFFFGANVGGWTPGRLTGDIQAIAEDQRPVMDGMDMEAFFND